VLIKWDSLPSEMQTEEVRKYYILLHRKWPFLILKRLFDVFLSLLLLVLVSPVLAIISVMIACDSEGGIIYRQSRVTKYNKDFRIHKFRTMVSDADKLGPAVTVGGDNRITKVGRILRKYRLDELPQLIDILQGNMSFVGTRPEVRKYVDMYSTEMMATLLLPAGVTSVASIKFKDEDKILENASDIEIAYVEEVLPGKMAYNLKYLRKANPITDLGIMALTVFSVIFR